jgi:ribonucleoside-diphosphate reductase alpha chain
MTIHLEPQKVSLDIFAKKYAKNGENPEQQRARVARALATAEAEPQQWEPVFIDAAKQGVVLAGRIQSAAGTDIEATLINCFVQPVGDALSKEKDGYPGIYTAIQEAAETMAKGGGVGYDFSRIRPRGALVKGTRSRASGPVSYMRVFNESCSTVESAGARRGAQMGVLRVDHPDILEFVHAKDEKGAFTNFNLSVGVTNAFMEAVINDEYFDLVHVAEPGAELIEKGAYRREDGKWVYRKILATELYDEVMRSTYDHAEPGILFLYRMNEENNLWYCEEIEATNPCAEEPLPPYGCCDLGSINLTKFVVNPFTEKAAFDIEAFVDAVRVTVRMLDNVLDITYWPLFQQKDEAHAKRRIGVGFLGLGDALVMLGIKYNSPEGVEMGAKIAEIMRDAAYMASVDLAKERGAFPLFNAEKYLQSGFAKRLPESIRKAIKKHGIRNSHLLAIAPTGTITLAFADNASNGIEPAFSWWYNREVRQDDGTKVKEKVYDHAYRLYVAQGGDPDNLPDYFVSALEMTASEHLAMVAAVQPFIDTSISKTVNLPVDYPFADFKDLYIETWKGGSKGLATFRPNDITGSVLSVESPKADDGKKQDFDESDPDRRIRLKELPTPTMASLRWEKRPKFTNGNPAHTYLVEHPHGYNFAMFIGHVENGKKHPFEVWVNGVEQPRGLGALAKSLSMDMRSNDRGWLKTKLESLMKATGDDAFDLAMPPDGGVVRVPSLIAGFAKLLHHRCAELGVFGEIGDTPLLDALMSKKEPKTGTDGTLSWTVDILNPATGDDFTMGLKELVLPDGERRPYSVWLSGNYPRVLDGLCKSLSYDMRVMDPAWVGAKLRQILDYAEPRGDFFAKLPGSEKQGIVPSTVAYMARLIIHRYSMLGILDEEGFPLQSMGMMETQLDPVEVVEPLQYRSVGAMAVMAGKSCPACHSNSLVKRDGCDFCTQCGHVGSCG